MDPARASILTLPNELLQNIFIELILDCEDPAAKVSYDRFLNDGSHPLHYTFCILQLLILRRVCRRFRTVVNELYFWYDRTYDFLIHPDHREYDIFSRQDSIQFRAEDLKRAKAARDHHENRLLKSLSADPSLAQILGLRKSWTFRSLELLTTAINCVPGFCENVESIVLANLDDADNISCSGLTSAINTLAVCRRLASLSLMFRIYRSRQDCHMLSIPQTSVYLHMAHSWIAKSYLRSASLGRR